MLPTSHLTGAQIGNNNTALPSPITPASWPQAFSGALDGAAAAIPIALGGVAIVYANFPAQYMSYGVCATLILLVLIHAVSAAGSRPMAFSARLFEATALSAMLHQFATYMPAWGLAARPETLLAIMCVVGALASIVSAILFMLGADNFTMGLSP